MKHELKLLGFLAQFVYW